MKIISTLILLLTLSACGSVTTLSRSDASVESSLVRQQTHCQSIPRLYSGVAYDFCFLYSTPTGAIDSNLHLGFYLIDSVLSAAIDTAALPYTIYRQATEGNLAIKSHYYFPH